ncbi:MAG: hypothetical protein ACOX5F_11655 [Anaerovoracaceae bacterium]|jgi:hypothetical protein
MKPFMEECARTSAKTELAKQVVTEFKKEYREIESFLRWSTEKDMALIS